MNVTLSSVRDVLDLFERFGDEPYGEEVSQTAHALQCAARAQLSDASSPLVAAALLHDVGHLLAGARGPAREEDDRHEAIGARALAGLFGPAVSSPVALHVVAKRWLCATDPAYVGSLSDASAASLRTQGGPLDEHACARFEASPGFHEALALRTWDDLAKDPAAQTGSMDDFEDLLELLALHQGV